MHKIMKVFLLLCLLLLSSTNLLYSQENTKLFSSFDVGAEIQVYPKGYMPGIRIEGNLKNNGSIHIRIGANIFDHDDYPKQIGLNNHDSEIGSGYGFSLGYKHYFNSGFNKMFISIKNDVWYNSVDWSIDGLTCSGCNPIETKGHTDIVVLQPTIEAGYLFLLGENQKIFITPELAVGYEWNVVVHGENTGFGYIIMGGVHIGYRF